MPEAAEYALNDPCNMYHGAGPANVTQNLNTVPVGDNTIKGNPPQFALTRDREGQPWFNDDAVNLVNGNLVKTYRILEFPTKCFPLAIVLFYNSQDTYTGPLGFGWTFTYDIHLVENPSTGAVTLKTGNGNEVTYTLSESEYTPPHPVGVGLTKNQDGTFQLTFRDGGVFFFDTQGRLSSVSDVDGNTLSLTRDAQGRLLAIEDDSSGRKVLFTYNAGSFITSIKAPDGAVTTIGYDYDLLRTITNPDGSTLTYEYNRDRRISRKLDANGVATDYLYSADGAVSDIVTGQGQSTLSFEYDTENLVTTVTDQAEKEWEVGLTENGLFASLADPLGNTTYFRNNRLNELAEVEDPTGRITTWTHVDHNVVSLTTPSSTITSFACDDENNLVLVRPSSAEERTRGCWVDNYGSEGHILCGWNSGSDEVSLPPYISSYSRGAASSTCNIANVNDLRGVENLSKTQRNIAYWYHPDEFTVTLDFAGEKLCNLALYSFCGDYPSTAEFTVTVTDKRGVQTHWVPNNMNGYWVSFEVLGDPDTSVTVKVERMYHEDCCISALMFDPPRGNTVRMEYDDHHHLTSVKDAYDNGSTMAWNEDGTLASVTDALGRETSLTSTTQGDVASVTDALNNTVELTHDLMGRVLTVRDSKGAVTSFLRDVKGRITRVTNAVGAQVQLEYDTADNVIAVIDEKGRRSSATYDTYSRLATVRDVFGNVTSFTHDVRGNLVSVIDPLTNETTYTWDDANRLTTVTYPDSTTLAVTYDAAGRILTVTRPEGGVTAYAYEADGRVETVTHPDGTQSRLRYDRYGNVVELIDGKGEKTLFTHDRVGRLWKVTDAEGGVTTYNWFEDAVYGLYKYGQKKYGGVSVGNLKSVTDARGYTTYYAHDSLDRLTSITYPDGTTEEFAWDDNGNLAERTDGKSDTTAYAWDALNRLTAVTYPDAKSMAFAFDTPGNLAMRIDPDGAATFFEHDPANRLRIEKKRESLTGALVDSRFFDYDAAGRMTTFEDTTWALKYGQAIFSDMSKYGEKGARYGAMTFGQTRYGARKDSLYGRFHYGAIKPFADGSFVTQYQYSDMDRLETLVDAEGRQAGYTYNDDGLVESITYPNGVTAASTYDDAGKLLTLTYSKSGNVISSYAFLYDDNGNKVRSDEKKGTLHGALSTYFYDSLDRLVEERQDLPFTTIGRADFLAGTRSGVDVTSVPGEVRLVPLSDTFGSELLDADRWTKAESNKGKLLLIDGLLLGYVTAQDSNASSAWMTTENRLKLTGDFDVRVDFEILDWDYDTSAAHLGFVFSASGGSMNVQRYNLAGNKYYGEVSGQSSSVENYDRIGKFRLARVGSTATAYYWNWGSSDWSARQSGTLTGDGFLALGVWTDQGWDNPAFMAAFDNLEVVKNNGVTNPVYGSNAYVGGNPEGTFTSAAYDGFEEVDFLKLFWEADTPTGTSVKFQVAANNDNATWNFVGPDGTSGTYFTSSGSSLPASCQGKRYIKYRAWLTTTDPTVTPALTYVHIPVNGATDQNPLSRIQYEFDATGNRTKKIEDSVTTNYTYDSANKMLTAGDAAFTWDDNGNLLTKTVGSDVTSFEWDHEDRLIQVTMPNSDVVQYEHDGLGRMTARIVNGQKTTFHHDGIDCITEVAPTGEVTARYTLAGEIISLHHADTPYFFHPNAIGSVETITDANGTVAARYENDAYGNLRNSTGSLDNDFRFVGAWGVRFDAVTGLYYMRARWYDPEAGRFISKDPVPTDNLYAYSGNNPVNLIDPLGLLPGEWDFPTSYDTEERYQNRFSTHADFEYLTNEPGLVESLIPVWGSIRQGTHDIMCGNWGWGLFNLTMAISDLIPIKAIFGIAGKGLFKLGSTKWGAVSRWANKVGLREFRGQPLHHWSKLTQRLMKKYPVLEFIGNQPWNLMPIPKEKKLLFGQKLTARQFHDAIEGKGAYAFKTFGRFYYGTPAWYKAAIFSTGGRGVSIYRKWDDYDGD